LINIKFAIKSLTYVCSEWTIVRPFKEFESLGWISDDDDDDCKTWPFRSELITTDDDSDENDIRELSSPLKEKWLN